MKKIEEKYKNKSDDKEKIDLMIKLGLIDVESLSDGDIKKLTNK